MKSKEVQATDNIEYIRELIRSAIEAGSVKKKLNGDIDGVSVFERAGNLA